MEIWPATQCARVYRLQQSAVLEVGLGKLLYFVLSFPFACLARVMLYQVSARGAMLLQLLNAMSQ